MGKKLLKKTHNVISSVKFVLAEFGKGASYALRH